MDIRQLKYFTAIVEEGTITAAAKKLNMTQPPLTAQLQLLESELGCQLFRHEGRRLYLTEAGRHFYQRASAIMGMCEAAAAEMADFSRGTSGTLRIGTVSSVQGEFFLDRLTHFGQQYPDIRYEIYSGNTYQLLDQTSSGQLDLAFVRTPFSAPDMKCLYLKEEVLLAAGLPIFFQGLSQNTISLRTLSEQPLIIYRRWETILKSSFENIGLIPSFRCCSNDAQTTLALAARGMGIGLLPESAIPVHSKLSLDFHKLTDLPLTSRIALICRSRQTLSETAGLFWDTIEKSLTSE